MCALEVTSEIGFRDTEKVSLAVSVLSLVNVFFQS